MRDDDHEHVIVRQKTNWGTRKIYHEIHPENPDEPACLKHQKASVEWRRQDPTALTDDWRECRYCAGTAGHGGATDPHELRDRLEDADPEDLGLAPIGEREEPEKPITERVAEGGQYGDPLEVGERPVPDDVGPAPEVDE